MAPPRAHAAGAPPKGAEARRDQRIPLSLQAVLTHGKNVQHLLTEDVSFRGVFLRTDDPPALQQWVQVSLMLPHSSVPLLLRGMAVHVVPYEDPHGRVPGVGLQFYGNDDDSRRRWERCIRDALLAPPPLPAAPGPEPIHRRHKRYQVAFEVRLGNVLELQNLCTRDVSAGGMFVNTPLRLPHGEEVRLYVIHPDTQVPFALDAKVLRSGLGPGGPGVALEFVHMDDALRAKFMAFVATHLPSPGTDVEEVVEVEAW